MLQHGAYTLLLDACYDREKFPTLAQAIDWCWASNEAEQEAVSFVLQKFFTEENGVFIQQRIQDELANFHKTSKTNKRIAQNREDKRRNETSTKRGSNSTKREPIVNEACELEHEAPPNHKPLTINQEPLTNSSASASPKEVIQWKKIQDSFNEILGEPLGNIRGITGERKKHILARIKEDSDKRSSVDWWGKYFTLINDSDHLTGRGQAWDKTGKPWKASFDWLITENHMIKILENKYNG